MRSVEISWKTIVFAVLFPLAIYFVWIIRDLLFSLLLAFIIMSALKPGVELLVRRRLRRFTAVVVVYLSFILFFTALILIILPPIISETITFAANIPLIIDGLEESIPNIDQYINLDSSMSYIPDATNRIFQFLGGFVSNAFFVVTTMFFAFYFLIEENVLKRLLSRYLEEDIAIEINLIVQKAEKRMSAWFWGELTLMTVIGVVSYIAYSIIGLRYALPLAVLAGLLEVVPNIGPVAATIPAILIGFSQSYFHAGTVLVFSFIIQQAENAFLVPIIMKRAVGINPIITLIALLLGGRIGGVLGVILAIPIFLIVETIITELFKERGRLSSSKNKTQQAKSTS